MPERIQFKLPVLTYRALHGRAPQYLCTFMPVSSLPGRRGLRSADSAQLVVHRTRLSTIGDRVLPVAGARIWNSLPANVISYPSLDIFCAPLKTHLFSISFSSVIVH